MREKKNNDKAMKHLRINALLVAGLIALVIVLLAYAWRFHSYDISSDPEDWAKFGEYVGGTLGAIYGLLAIVGVLITVAESRESHRNELRPWIQITAVQMRRQFQCIDNKWQFGFDWSIKNVGKSVALRTHFVAKMLPEMYRGTPEDWIADISKLLRSLVWSPELKFAARGSFGRFLFPDVTLEGFVDLTNGMPDPVDRGISERGYSGRIVLLLGVTYQSPLDPPDKWRETCEAYVISVVDQHDQQVRIQPTNGEFLLGTTCRVHLRPHEVADNYVT